MCSGSYRHRQCCYLCKAISHTVDEDESQGLIYTYYGRDAEYRQVQLGCIDIPGPWLHPIARHESEDGNYRWFHWNQWRNTFHDDSWIHSLEMFGSTLVATWLFVSTSVSFQFWSVRNLSWPSPYTGLDDISWPLCKLIYPDLYASSYMLWTDTSNIFSGRGRDDRLQKIYLRYVQWCVENRPLPLIYKYVSHCLVFF